MTLVAHFPCGGKCIGVHWKTMKAFWSEGAIMSCGNKNFIFLRSPLPIRLCGR